MRYNARNTRGSWQSYLFIILGSLLIAFGLMAFMPVLVPLFFVICGFWLLNYGFRMQNKPPLRLWATRLFGRFFY